MFAEVVASNQLLIIEEHRIFGKKIVFKTHMKATYKNQNFEQSKKIK